MDIIELLTRRTGESYSIEEAQFVVEKYIEKQKGVKVKINIYKGMPENLNNLNPFGWSLVQMETQKLFEAFIVATKNLTINDFQD